MLPLRDSICGRLTQDLPLGHLQGGNPPREMRSRSDRVETGEREPGWRGWVLNAMPAQVPKGLYEKDGNFDRVKCRAEHFYFVSSALNLEP